MHRPGCSFGERIRGSELSEDVVLVIGSVEKMEVKIEVGEHDVVFVNPGQKALIEIDALPDVAISGHVIDNARDAIVKNAGTDNEAPVRVPGTVRLVIELAVLLGGAVAVTWAGETVFGVVLAVLVVFHYATTMPRVTSGS